MKTLMDIGRTLTANHHFSVVKKQVEESTKKGESLAEFWERLNEERNKIWLTGSSAESVWDTLNVKDKIRKRARVLNIGVGFGYDTRALTEKGCWTDALDISVVALNRVKPYAYCLYMANRVDELQSDVYDLALSHLVAQHMLDSELSIQMNHVIRSLTKEGIFAIQFASAIDGNNQDGVVLAKSGMSTRSIEEFADCVTENGGAIVWLAQKGIYPKWNIVWHVAHIKKVV